MFYGAEYNKEQYKGLLQEDLIKAISNMDKCRDTIWKDLKDILLKETPSKRDQTNIVSDRLLLSRQRIIFKRPAFQTSAYQEIFLKDLLDAIDASVMAINTGKLYSREKQLVAEFPPVTAYKNPAYIKTFDEISEMLSDLKRSVIEFQVVFNEYMKNYKHHENFFPMFNAASREMNCGDLALLLIQEDQIDIKRNEILEKMNYLLVQNKLDQYKLIKTSSGKGLPARCTEKSHIQQ